MTQTGEPTITRPYAPETIRAGIAQRVRRNKRVDIGYEERWRGLLVGSLNRAAGSASARYLVLFYLFPDKWKNVAEVTTKGDALNNAEWWALEEWIGPWKDQYAPEGAAKWKYHAALEQECRWILKEMGIEQLEMPMEEPILDMPPVGSIMLVPQLAEPVRNVVYDIDPENGLPKIDPNTPAPEKDTSEAWLAMLGPGAYRMKCGHLNTHYSAAGWPVCKPCTEKGYPLAWKVAAYLGDANADPEPDALPDHVSQPA